MGNKAYKGRRFEIWLASKFSLWWSDGERDDIFYHTHDSGGRATKRAAKGKTTKNLHGDIHAVDPIGQPLMDFVAIEAKNGYSAHTIANLLDKSATTKKQVYEEWIEKAEKHKENAGSFSWMLITRRDRKVALVFMPIDLAVKLAGPLNRMTSFGPTASFYLPQLGKNRKEIFVITLDDWLACVKPSHIKELLKKCGRRNEL